MRIRNICLFINLFVCFFAKGQQAFTLMPFAKKNIAGDTTRHVTSIDAHSNNFAVSPLNNTLIKTVPSTFYYNSIGFFCQKELQIEKALNFPVKFRLGSVNYTDQMEGKGKEIYTLDKRR